METERGFGFSESDGNPRNEEISRGNVIVIEPISVPGDVMDFSSSEQISSKFHHHHQLRQHQKMKSILNHQSSSSSSSSSSSLLVSALTSPLQPTLSLSSNFPSSSSSSSSTPQILHQPSMVPQPIFQLRTAHLTLALQTSSINAFANQLTSASTGKPKLQSILLPAEQIKNRSLANQDDSGAMTPTTPDPRSGTQLFGRIPQIKKSFPKSTDVDSSINSVICSPVQVAENGTVASKHAIGTGRDVGDTFIEVVCGDNTAQLNLNRLAKGTKVSCVWFDGTYMTPNQFQHASGRATARDWKRSIKHSGSSLKVLMFNQTITLAPAKCRCNSCSPQGSGRRSRCSDGKFAGSNPSCSPRSINNSLDSSYSIDQMSASLNDQHRESSASSSPLDLTFRSRIDLEVDLSNETDMGEPAIEEFLRTNDPAQAADLPLDLSKHSFTHLAEWRGKVELMKTLQLDLSPLGALFVEKMQTTADSMEKAIKLRKVMETRSLKRHRSEEQTVCSNSNPNLPLNLVLPFKKRYQPEFLDRRFDLHLPPPMRPTEAIDAAVTRQRSIANCSNTKKEDRSFATNGFQSNIGASLNSECYTVNSSLSPRVNKEIFSHDLETKINFKIKCKRSPNEENRQNQRNCEHKRFAKTSGGIPFTNQTLPFSNPEVFPNTFSFNCSFGMNYIADGSIPVGSNRDDVRPDSPALLVVDLVSDAVKDAGAPRSGPAESRLTSILPRLDIKTSVLKRQFCSPVGGSAVETSDLPELVTNHHSPSPDLEAVIKTIMQRMLQENHGKSFEKAPTRHSHSDKNAETETTFSTSAPKMSSESHPFNGTARDPISHTRRPSNDDTTTIRTSEAGSKFCPESTERCVDESTVHMREKSEDYLPDLIQSNRLEREPPSSCRTRTKSLDPNSDINAEGYTT